MKIGSTKGGLSTEVKGGEKRLPRPKAELGSPKGGTPSEIRYRRAKE